MTLRAALPLLLAFVCCSLPGLSLAQGNGDAGNVAVRTQVRAVVDTDSDGLSDGKENSLGTSPTKADTDGDGVGDGVEVTDGTNPKDVGSFYAGLGASVCSEWNGSLGGMLNIMEHVNLTPDKIPLSSVLRTISGAAQSPVKYSINGGSQYDLLVHGLTGYSVNSYGLICSSERRGRGGLFDGRMVHYKLDSAGAYQFAMAMPFSAGLSGKQHVGFNTVQPSSAEKDAGNLVADWIQLTNLESKRQRGQLSFYSQSGAKLNTQRVSLAAGGRSDFPAHDLGVSEPGQTGYGFAEWIPDTAGAKFLLRSIRYYYDNPGTSESFAGALQVSGKTGTGEPLILPLDARKSNVVIEITNVRNISTRTSIKIYDQAGAIVFSGTPIIKSRSTLHVLANTYLAGMKGLAIIDGEKSTSLIANALHYQNGKAGAVDTFFAIEGQEAFKGTLRGSYNTYLGQRCEIWVANPSSSVVSVNINLTRVDGTVPSPDQTSEIPGHGIKTYDLCSRDTADVYGVVTVTPPTGKSVISHVIRVGQSNAYRFPTPVR